MGGGASLGGGQGNLGRLRAKHRHPSLKRSNIVARAHGIVKKGTPKKTDTIQERKRGGWGLALGRALYAVGSGRRRARTRGVLEGRSVLGRALVEIILELGGLVRLRLSHAKSASSDCASGLGGGGLIYVVVGGPWPVCGPQKTPTVLSVSHTELLAERAGERGRCTRDAAPVRRKSVRVPALNSQLDTLGYPGYTTC